MNSKPLAIIDSGLGGLTIAKTIWQLLPKEPIIYLADHQFFPYGNKSEDQINQRLTGLMDFLVKKKIKAVVVACNTITTTSINLLRSNYQMPFIGTEPAVKVAIDKNLKPKIIVLGTKATINSQSFKKLVNRFDQTNKVMAQACPGLVEVIESGQISKIKKAINQHLTKLKEPYSALVLGCTHYILVKDLFKQLTSSKTLIIEPSLAIAKQTEHVLISNNLTTSLQPHQRQCHFFTNGNPAKVSKTASKLLKQSIIFEKCSI